MKVKVKAIMQSNYKSEDGFQIRVHKLESEGWEFIEEIMCGCIDCLDDIGIHDYVILKLEIH